MSHSIFGSDRPLLYDVEPWNGLGFGVPNFGNNYGTLSTPIWNLASQVSKSQLFIMTHIDAQRTQPPSINTVMRIAKVLNRVQSILQSRMKPFNEIRIEEGHATADLKPWQVNPVPFFSGPVVRNGWLMEYNSLTMTALTNIYQHSDNNLALTVTEAFARDVFPYFKEIRHLVGIELLQLPPATVEAENFVFAEEHYAAYKPDSVTLNFEPLDTPGRLQSRATEDDLRPLFTGFPANMIVSNLKEYPVDNAELGKQGTAFPDETQIDHSAKVDPGGSLGDPQI